MLRSRPAVRWPAAVLGFAFIPVFALAAPVRSTQAARPRVLGSTIASAELIEVPHAAPSRPSRAAPRRAALPVFVAPSGERISVERIQGFLLRKRSPMAPYAEMIVREAVTWRVDPRVVVAIAGKESSFGLIRRGYNAWGWNVRTTRYASWENAIHRFTKAFSLHYQGMRYGNFSAGAATYNPPSPGTWAQGCRAYFNAI